MSNTERNRHASTYYGNGTVQRRQLFIELGATRCLNHVEILDHENLELHVYST